MNDVKPSVLIIGRSPPPIGGVTKYCTRLHEGLVKRGFSTKLLDIRDTDFISLITCMKKYDICHVNISHGPGMLFLVILGKLLSKRSIVTLHGDYDRLQPIRKFLTSLSFGIADEIILLNQYSYDLVKEFSSNANLIGTNFPVFREEPIDLEIIDRLKQIRNLHNLVVITSAFDFVLKDEVEIYGITELLIICIQMNIMLIILDPSGNYKPKLEFVLADNSASNIVIISEQVSFYNMLEHVDLYIRNTSEDGDSLSINEALSKGVTVWATNVVKRPEGVNVYSELSEIPFSTISRNEIVDVKRTCDLVELEKVYLKG